MNAGFRHHFTYRVWEEYAMGAPSGRDSARLEKHLLVCSACQDLLAQADEYIEIMKTAARRSRRKSKSVAAAATLR
jgi:predicted anti-sigma-YlaC factor YlaD